MELKAVRINCMVQVGELSQEKIIRLKEAAKDDFPLANGVPMGLALVNPVMGRHILVMPTQVSFVVEDKQIVTFDKDFADKWLHKIFEILLLDPVGGGVFQFVAHAPLTAGGMDYLLSRIEWFRELKGVVGLGVKTYFDFPQYAGEMRIEPLLADPNRLYFEFQGNTKQKISLKELFTLVEESMTNFDTWVSKSVELIQNH